MSRKNQRVDTLRGGESAATETKKGRKSTRPSEDTHLLSTFRKDNRWLPLEYSKEHCYYDWSLFTKCQMNIAPHTTISI